MISFQNQEQLSQLFAALQGRYRQPLALRIVIGVIMLAAGGGAAFLGVMTFLEGNEGLTRAYELLVSAIMVLLAWSGSPAFVRTVGAEIRRRNGNATRAASACGKGTYRNGVGGGVSRGIRAVRAETGSILCQFPVFRAGAASILT